MRELAEMIIRLAGTGARLSFDLLKPSGQPRRRCDVTKATKELGFTARVALPEGLAKTIEWYRAHERGAVEAVRR